MLSAVNHSQFEHERGDWFNADYLGKQALLDGGGKKQGVEKREKQGEGKLTEVEEQEERAHSK